MRVKVGFLTFPWHTDSKVAGPFGMMLQFWLIVGIPVHQWVAEKPFGHGMTIVQIALIAVVYMLLYWLHRNPVREGMRDDSVG